MWRSLTQYHPRVGYTFVPGIKSRVAHEAGGYLIRANQLGFRADREFTPERTAGKRRVLVFGDSQTAGDGVSNGERTTDVLERELGDGVEVYNFGLPGTGTDQQYLAWQSFVAGHDGAPKIEHDLLVLAVHVENIGRVANRYRPYTDERGREVIYAKPYFELREGRLVLGHVPPPKDPWTSETLPPEAKGHVDRGLPFPTVRKIVKALGVRDLVQRVTGYNPVPDYDDPKNPKWLVLRAILEQWIRESPTKVIVAPIPLFSFWEGDADASAYQARFRELCQATGATLADPLPELLRHPEEERRRFRFQVDVHFTPAGHRAVGRALAGPVRAALEGAGSAAP